MGTDLETVQQLSKEASNRAECAEGQICQLEKLRQNLAAELQATASEKDASSQQCRVAQERAAGLAVELESKHCRLR